MNRNFLFSRLPRRTWSIQYQMMLPVLAIVVWLVFRQVTATSMSATDQLDARESLIPLKISQEVPASTSQVTRSSLERLAGRFPGWQFVVIAEGRVTTSTVQLEPWNKSFLAQLPRITYGPQRERDFVIFDEADSYWVAPIYTPTWPEQTRLIALHSRDFALRADERIITEIENTGGVIIALLIGLGVWYTRRLSHRVVNIQQQIRQIADGDLSNRVQDHGRDEVNDLACSVNSMVDELAEMKNRIQGAERTRLHSQIASGIAHELRNGIHSARLSLEMLDDRCRRSGVRLPEPELLTLSMDQLSVTESLVRRLLSLGKPQHRQRIPRPLTEVIQEVLAVTEAIFHHAEVQLESDISACPALIVSDSDAMQSAILNLCMNAIEATGSGGRVRLSITTKPDVLEITVADNGPGPDPVVASTLFEPFVTTKPEGIGLGLVLVQQTAVAEGGTVTWQRSGDWTMFTISLPLQAVDQPLLVSH